MRFVMRRLKVSFTTRLSINGGRVEKLLLNRVAEQNCLRSPALGCQTPGRKLSHATDHE